MKKINLELVQLPSAAQALASYIGKENFEAMFYNLKKGEYHSACWTYRHGIAIIAKQKFMDIFGKNVLFNVGVFLDAINTPYFSEIGYTISDEIKEFLIRTLSPHRDNILPVAYYHSELSSFNLYQISRPYNGHKALPDEQAVWKVVSEIFKYCFDNIIHLFNNTEITWEIFLSFIEKDTIFLADKNAVYLSNSKKIVLKPIYNFVLNKKSPQGLIK